MDAIALSRESDPDRSNRVVRPRPDRKSCLRFHALEFVIGIVSIEGISIHGCHLERSIRRWLFVATDGRRKKAKEFTRFPERLDGLPSLVDFDVSDGCRRLVSQ